METVTVQIKDKEGKVVAEGTIPAQDVHTMKELHAISALDELYKRLKDDNKHS